MGVEYTPSIGFRISNTVDIFNIPELHLMLGVGQKLYDAIVGKLHLSEWILVSSAFVLKVFFF